MLTFSFLFVCLPFDNAIHRKLPSNPTAPARPNPVSQRRRKTLRSWRKKNWNRFTCPRRSTFKSVCVKNESQQFCSLGESSVFVSREVWLENSERSMVFWWNWLLQKMPWNGGRAVTRKFGRWCLWNVVGGQIFREEYRRRRKDFHNCKIATSFYFHFEVFSDTWPNNIASSVSKDSSTTISSSLTRFLCCNSSEPAIYRTTTFFLLYSPIKWKRTMKFLKRLWRKLVP